MLFGVLIGSFVAWMRMANFAIWKIKPLRIISSIYVEVIRGTPLLLQLYFFYFLLPELLPFFNASKFACITVALFINSSGYVAEIIRAGVQAVDHGQTEAARSLGLTQAQTMKLVVLPQAVKNILPTLANELVTMIKESSICGTIMGIQELMWGAKTVATTTHLMMSPYLLAAAIYFCINFPATKAIEAFERRMRRGDVR